MADGPRRARAKPAIGLVVFVIALAVFIFGPIGWNRSRGRIDGPVLVSGPTDSVMTAIVRGEVSIADGCLRLEGTHAIVWPTGTRWDGERVLLDDGTRVELDDTIESGGGYLASVRSIAGADVNAEAIRCSLDGEIAVVQSEVRVIEP